MKKLVVLSAFLAQAVWMQAQVYVDGVKLEPANTGQYIEIDPKYKSNGSCVVSVDYGNVSKDNAYFITDEQGRRIEFRSTVDALNFLYAEGWEVSQVTKTENSGRRYLLKRRY